MGNFDLFRRSLSSTYFKGEVDVLPSQQQEVDIEIEALKKRAKNAHSALDTKLDTNFHSHIATTQSYTPSASSLANRQLENILSRLLKYGVLIASTVVLLGGIIYLINQWDEPARYSFFIGQPPELRSPDGVFKAVLAGNDKAVIQLGLLLLVATPILRVIVSFFTFLRLRNFIYVVITLLVLISLTFSIFVIAP
jgi:uncharacterized membrane protein